MMFITQKLTVFIKQTVTVEPLLICYVTAKAICDPVFKNLELEKSCRVNSRFNSTVCKDITAGVYIQNNFTEENNVVQSHITSMHSWQLTTSNVLAIILILLLGSYSDRHKIRKPFILLTLFGQLLALTGCILCVVFMNQWPLEVQGVLQEIVYSLFGGEKLLLMVIYAYIADISTQKMRTVRVAFIQALWNICTTIGQLLGGALLKRVGYMPVLSVAFFLFATSFLYGLLVIKEPRKSEEPNSRKEMILDTFNSQHFIQTFKVFTKYKGTQRINIVSILIVVSIYSTVSYGESSVMFLFTQTTYEWTTQHYSVFAAMGTIINSLGLFVIVPIFTKMLQLHDLIIAALAFLNRIIINTIFIIIRSPTGLYIGCGVGIIKTATLVGVRSQLTKCVSEDDVGKILSIYTVVDSLSDGIASQIYNNGIYEYTRVTFPHAFLLLGIALNSSGIIILMCIYFKKSVSDDSKTKDVEVQEIAKDTETTHL